MQNTGIDDFSPEERELLELLLKEEGLDASNLPIFPQSRSVSSFPLSFAQQRLWFINQLDSDNVAYNVHYTLRCVGPLDVQALRQSISDIVRRHDILRTTFQTVDGEPVQIIGPSEPAQVSLIDLSELSDEAQASAVSSASLAHARHRFDLSSGPLLRIGLLRLSAREHIAMFVMHHIISDAWSTDVFIRELATLYDCYAAGVAPSLPELPVQYADYAVWQRQHQSKYEAQLEYWKRRLCAVPPVLQLNVSRLRPAINTHRGATQSRGLSRELSEQIKDLSLQENATLFMVLLAAYMTLLYRYSGQTDLVVGTPIANRERTEVENLIGFFVNTLAVRGDLSGEPTFRELIRRVKEITLEAHENGDVPFETLVDELRPERDLNRYPLFQVWFVLQNATASVLKLKALDIEPIRVEDGTAKFDLMLSVTETDQDLTAALNYATDLFKDDTIERMLGHFQTMLESAVDNPDQSIAQLGILSESETHQLLVSTNKTRRSFGRERCVHELFEDHVEQTPDAPAVCYEDECLTYRELSDRTNRLAQRLVARGVKPETRVALVIDRGIEMIVGILGILKAGAAYVPLDPNAPKDRLAFMIEDACAPLVVTRNGLAKELPAHQPQIVLIDEDFERDLKIDVGHNTACSAAPHNLAYIIYTSGSTGRPKGVAVEHRQLFNYTSSLIEKVALPARSSFAMISTFAADLGHTAIFPSLCSGGCLHVISEETSRDAEALAEYCQRHPIDLLKIVPSHLTGLLASTRADQILPRKRLILGGEATSWGLVDKIEEMAQECEIVNHYGPTETTVGVLTYALKKGAERSAASLPVGRPLWNTQIYLLDPYQQPVPAGCVGEIYVGGKNVARGYVNHPSSTAERFIPDPFSDEPGARLYRTGDVARQLTDGILEILGRVDHQVKIRGYRVELGEVEAVLREHPAVLDGVVVAHEDEQAQRQLVAYVVAQPGSNPHLLTLRSFFELKLPDYMVPSTFMMLEKMPLTSNGKVDRGALPKPQPALAKEERVISPPRDSLEIQLAQVMKDVLGVSGQISITDNFFELGGHSIRAVRLMALIRKWFGQRLPLSILFQGATVEYLAQVLRGQVSSMQPSPLVAIQPKGSRTPFFCVHTGSGEVLSYERWAFHLGNDQPFYGLQDHLAYQEEEPELTLEDLASRYVEAVRTIQYTGPYLLGGWSFGGLVAFEMAQQLKHAGEEVNLLALVDTATPAFSKRVVATDDATLLTIIANQVTRSTLKGHEIRRLIARLRELGSDDQLQHVLKYFAEKPGSENVDPAYALEFLRRQLRIFKSRVRMGRNYRASFYTSRIALFRPLEEPDELKKLDQSKGWGELSLEPVDIYRVPGNHQTMGLEPNAGSLAQKLSECLERAQTTPPKELFEPPHAHSVLLRV